MENKISFSRRVQRLIKKLNIELTDYELKNIEGIEPREFTERRAFKTIEVPYKGNETAFLLQPNAYFFYKGMRTYKKRKLFFVKEFEGEIYITIREIVLYDRKNNEIQEIVPHIDIDKIVLRNEYVEIKMRDGKDSLYLRHKDNELIYISLKRIVTIRGGGGFVAEQRDEFMTTERTIESFLNISDTNESKVKVKANKKKKKK